MNHQNSNINHKNHSMLKRDDSHSTYPNAIAEDSIGPYDVLCGRHKLAFNNVGNRRMRVTISLALRRYLDQRERHGKSLIIKSVVEEIKSNGGRFLRWSNEGTGFVEIDDKKAHQKCSHAFRDMVNARGLSTPFTNNSSSSNSDNNGIIRGTANNTITCSTIFKFNSSQQEEDTQNNVAPSHQDLTIPEAAVSAASAAKIDPFVNIFDDESLEAAAEMLLAAPIVVSAQAATSDGNIHTSQKHCSSDAPSSDDSTSNSSESSSSSDIWFEFENSIKYDDHADFFAAQDAEDERILFNKLFEQEIIEQEIKSGVDDDYNLDGIDHDLPLSKKSMDR